MAGCWHGGPLRPESSRGRERHTAPYGSGAEGRRHAHPSRIAGVGQLLARGGDLVGGRLLLLGQLREGAPDEIRRDPEVIEAYFGGAPAEDAV